MFPLSSVRKWTKVFMLLHTERKKILQVYIFSKISQLPSFLSLQLFNDNDKTIDYIWVCLMSLCCLTQRKTQSCWNTHTKAAYQSVGSSPPFSPSEVYYSWTIKLLILLEEPSFTNSSVFLLKTMFSHIKYLYCFFSFFFANWRSYSFRLKLAETPLVSMDSCFDYITYDQKVASQ